MTLPFEMDNEETTPNGNAQNISGKNVIASILAEGSAQVNVSQIIYSQPSELEEERERQKAELDVLQKAIVQRYLDLNQLIDMPAPTVGNPYLFLQPFGFTDRANFLGRDTEITELFQRVTSSPITFLNGNHRMGKTSLLRAGLTPILLKQKHLPLVVNVSSEPLEASIKKELLPNVDRMPFLNTISLTEFIVMITSALPDGKILVVLVDDFEAFFNDKEHSEQERNDFYNEWRRCFNRARLNVHWLFCIPSNRQYLLNFFKREIQPNPNTISVPPFDRTSAQTAMLKPAERRGIKVEEEVVTSILDILGGKDIDPAALQLVCYILAGGNSALSKEWTMEYYAAQGKADGILRDYLDRTIEELEPVEREPAWQVLAVLADPAMQISTEQQLVEKLELYDVKENLTHRVLVDLESNNLIERGPAFKLTSDSLLPRIEKWKETRSARERARAETLEQLRNIRNSALRGLLAGAIGFIAFDQIIYISKGLLLQFSFMFFKILIDISIGTLAGLVLVFSVDVALAAYSGPRRWLAYLGATMGGALALAWALVSYTNLIYLGDEKFFRTVPKAILEGGLWGAAAGIGTAWVLKSQQPYWITIPTCILISSATMMATNSIPILGVLKHSVITDSTLLIGVAGAVLPAFILVAAMIGKRKPR